MTDVTAVTVFTVVPATLLAVGGGVSAWRTVKSGERRLFLLVGVLVLMLAHQLLEARTVVLGGPPVGGLSEVIETGANTLTTVAVYYGTTVFERERTLSDRLRESERRYRALTERSPVPILVHTDERIRYANGAAADLFGARDPDELVDRPVGDILRPEDEQRIADRIETVLDGEEISVADERVVGLDGRERDVLVSGGRVEYEGDPAVQLVFRDVTQERTYRRKYEQTESRLRVTIESSNDAMFLIDQEADEIIDANESAASLLRYERPELIGLSPFAIHPHERVRFDEFLERVHREDGVVTDDLSCLRRDGVEVPVEVSASPVEVEGRECVLAMVRDITERERRRRQVSVLSRLLRHNLRNDMNVVIGQAEFVESETDDERVRDAVRKIQTKASDLVDLSQRVRDLQALIQKSGTEDEEVTVRPLVEAVVSEARAGYPAADITVDVPDETVVYATRQTLAWAVSNLVENAVEHNDAENPSVTVSAEFAEERRGEWVALTVSDDGPGIPEFERSVATDAHEQTDLAHATGIGLWIVGQVVEAFDGSIAFADGGDGSEVTLYLQGTVDAGAVAT